MVEDSRSGRWSLSEFLGLLEIRSQCWCQVVLGEEAGFSVRHSDCIHFYAVLEGEASISGVEMGSVILNTGDIALLPTGDSHAVRFREEGRVEGLDFLNKDSYTDSLAFFEVGERPIGARLLCARLKVRWPFGNKPKTLPLTLRIAAEESPVSVAYLAQLAGKSGAAAVLTRAAAFLFTAAFRDSPEAETHFQASYTYDPISRAREIIDRHPFKEWTVQILASKVGMGRSNFAARFVATVGKTPIDYVTAERMKHAVRLLEQTDLKIAAIGEHVGYRSEAAFSRRFSDYFGLSPGKMRESMRQNGTETP